MGMFDYVRCELPLPLEASVDQSRMVEFQTKDTPCNLDTYIIGADRQLMVAKWLGDQASNDTPVKCDYTGWIYFYTSVRDDPKNRGWVEFKAKFFDGIVQTIELVEFR